MESKLSQVMHWGSSSGESSSTPCPPSPSDVLLEIGAKSFCTSQKQRIALTIHGTVHKITLDSSGEFRTEVRSLINEIISFLYLVLALTVLILLGLLMSSSKRL